MTRVHSTTWLAGLCEKRGREPGGQALSVLYSQPSTLAYGEVLVGVEGDQKVFWVSPSFQTNFGTGGRH